MSDTSAAAAAAGDGDPPVAAPSVARSAVSKAWSAFRSWRERQARRVGRWLRRHSMAVYITLFFLLMAVVVLAPNIFITVPPGHVGVMWYRFFGGTVTTEVHDEGMHVIFPWDRLYIYDARLQNAARVYDTISSNGLSMQVEIAVRYRINRSTAGLLHKLVGPEYPDILVYPEIGSHARELISRYTPEQLYTETRGFIQAEILQRMVNQLGSSLANQSFGGRLVTVEDVLLRSVVLPPVVADAIERKAAQYQLMLEYDFRLAREEKERERKRIEAEGVRDFQDIVAKTITEEYLRLRGIEATLALATSKNSKTVIVGGRDGLPLILNTEGSEAPLTDDAGTAPAAAEQSILDQISNPSNARAPEGPAAMGGSAEPATGAGTLSSGSVPDPLKKPALPPMSAAASSPADSVALPERSGPARPEAVETPSGAPAPPVADGGANSRR